MTDPRDASEPWIAEQGRSLRRLALGLLGDEARAEDVVQDAWVAALDAPGPRHLPGWLVTVTRRLAGRAQRTAARRRGREEAVAHSEAVPAADTIAARSEIVRRLGEIVHALPEPFREALVLRFWEGLPPRTVAARLDVPVATVRSRTRRGLERVREELSQGASEDADWRQSLALAFGLEGSLTLGTASTTTTLGALSMKTKIWIAAAGGLLAVTLAGTYGATWLRPSAPDETARATLAVPDQVSREAADEATLGRVAEGDLRSEIPAPPVRPERPARRASIRVLDPEGRPVVGAEVRGGARADDLRITTFTDDEGGARLDHTADLQLVCALAPGWAPTPLLRVPGPEAGPVELVLRLPQRGAELAVEVLGPGGVAMPDARVHVGRHEDVEVRLADGSVGRTVPSVVTLTDASGVARFPGLAPGWAKVSASHDDLAGASAFTTLELGRKNRVALELSEGITVLGRVRNELGAPIERATVTRSSQRESALTEADGSFRLGPVPPGKLVVVGPAGRRLEERIDGAPGDLVRWDPILPSEPALRGRVVDGSGVALPGWAVSAHDDTWPGWARGTITDDRGRFVFHAPPPGPLRLEVRRLPELPFPLLVREGLVVESRELRLEVQAGRRGGVTGRLVRDDGLEPALLAPRLRHVTTPGRQRLTGGDGLSITPEEDGAFAATELPAGDYELVLVGAPFGWVRVARFSLAEGEELNLGVIATPTPGLLRARTWWGGPEPLGDASYLLERRAELETVMSFRGSFPEELSLAPGRYTLQTEVTPGPQRELTFEIEPGRTTEIELDLSATCLHRVRVGYASGRPPTGELALEVRRTDDDQVVAAARVARTEDGSWVHEVELGSGRFEFVARDGAAREAHATENLYTSRPGREVFLLFSDR